jgi:hypothetical protein
MAKTKEQRREAIAELKARLDAFQGGLDDEMRTMILARFSGYSPRNAMLVAMQRPGATEVRGFKAWLSMDRVVRKGESGIQILAPAGNGMSRAEMTKHEADEGYDGERPRRQFFRLAYVFDVDQTDELERGEG